MITQTINLNLIPGGVLPRINVSQYDKGSRTLNFNIYNGSVLFNIPSGSTVTIQGTKPDHTGFQYSCEYEGSVVTADLEQQMSVISGEVTCEITINKNLELIGTGNFILNVEPAAVKDNTVISETELPLIEQAIEATAEAEASATSAAESAAEAASWSANPPYIGENGNWYVYDPETEEFVDTGDPSRGPQGIQGETGSKGDTGATPDITMNASVDNTSGTPAVVVTETGTDEDPVFSLAFSGLKGPQGDTGEQGETGPQGPTGPAGNGISNITKTGTSGLVDTYTITYTDGTTSTFTVTNGHDGTGSGDMSMSDYDPTGSVKNDGGIPDFIADQISGKQNIILASALPIGGINRTTVEDALGALANETGGHTIVNSSGTELPQRSKLQFEGCEVTDDSTNDITKIKAEGGVIMANNAGAHNAIYRGKALGTSVTSAQYAAIDAGTFKDLYIGDYWTINGVNYRIAAFDYWLHCGDTECITHHVVIVPDTCLETKKKMNDSNVTTGGYPGSKMYGTGVDHSGGNLEGSVNIIKTAFGNDHLLVHREYIANAVSSGRPSAGAWMDSKVDLMNEHMVYGGKFFEVTSDGSTVPNVYSTSKSQLALFRLDPSRITNRVGWWLRDPVSAAAFANVHNDGFANYLSASYANGVRPAFAIYKP